MIVGHTELLQATVLVDIALVLLAGGLLLRLGRRAGQPAVIGEILAGIALGPSLLGLLPGHLTTHVFPPDGRPHLAAIAQVGLLLFMFVLGWELEPERIGRAPRAVALVTLGSMAVPFVLGLGAAALLYHQHSQVGADRVDPVVFAVFLGISMSVTAFPVLARILTDRGLSTTRVGTLTLSSAAAGDVLAWCLLALVIGASTASGAKAAVITLGGAVLYVTLMALVVRPVLRGLVRRWNRPGAASTDGVQLAAFAVAGIFLSSYATTLIGIHPIFGAFAFGLVMPREPRAELGTRMIRPLQTVSMLLMPVYFIITGLSVDIGGLRAQDWLALLLLTGCACVGKLLGTTLPSRGLGLSWPESLSVGVLMNVRGLTELIILNIGLSLGILDTRMFTVMVLVALITTAAAGPLLSRLRTPAPVLPASRPVREEEAEIAA